MVTTSTSRSREAGLKQVIGLDELVELDIFGEDELRWKMWFALSPSNFPTEIRLRIC